MNKTIQTLLRNSIKLRLDCEYMAPGASQAKRSYYQGRIAALLACMTEEPESVLAQSVNRYTTERHQPGDDITYPEGTSVQWMQGCIQAAQDVLRGAGSAEVPEQAYGSAVVPHQ